MEKLIGNVSHYLFHNDENGYSIAKIKTEEDTHIIVGYFPILNKDVLYEFTGEWITHNTYGLQFKIESYKKLENQNKKGIVSYLSSPLFYGIGPVTAEKIVDTFGVDAVQKILDNKTILKEIGLSNIRIEKFYQQLKEHQLNEHILVELYGYDLTARLAMKLLKKYEYQTLEKLEENPYRLIEEVEGIGFIKADEIAAKLGIEKDDPKRVKAAIFYVLNNISYQSGDIYLDKESLEDLTNKVVGGNFFNDEIIDFMEKEGTIIIEDDRYYLQNAYLQEIEVADDIKRLNKPLNIDLEYIEMLLSNTEIKRSIEYTKTQKEAILTSLINKVSIITGGPGTGKTTIIDGLLETYKTYYKIKSNYDAQTRIALMAPTGRAAKRMSEILDFNAKTIHRQLGYNYEGFFIFDRANKLPYDLIIVDEASMIDLALANKLLQAIKDDAQVVIVGDVDQLPSVGAGQVLADLINSNTIPTVRLNEIHRQAKDSKIVTLASKVNNQNLTYNDLNSNSDVYLYSEFGVTNLQKTILDQIQGAVNEGYSLIDDIQVLAPMYKGDLGIDRLNVLIQKVFNRNPKDFIDYGDKTFSTGDKVIQLQNDPERMVMNGDIGVIKDIRYSTDNEKYLVVDFDGNEVNYLKSDLDLLNLAYALTIHKSQGSEYQVVIMPMVKAFTHMLKKELIYTAITRAKKYLIILGDMKLLIYAANHLAEKRKTTLKLRLTNEEQDTEISPYDFM